MQPPPLIGCNPPTFQTAPPAFDKRPEQEPFPFGFQFSIPARYHNADQTFAIGDLVWFEIKGNFGVRSGGIQWGEAVVKDVLPGGDKYCLAGKTWSYDHLTHPLIGIKGGPPSYQSINDIHQGRHIYRQWAQIHHPNSHVRRMALNGIDEVMHPSLSCVPKAAMFKVWDREEIPTCPIPNHLLEAQTQQSSKDDCSRGDDYSLQDAQKKYGMDLQYLGTKQNGLGPEYWGITIQQLLAVQNLPKYKPEMKMYDVVETLIKPITKGTGMGYSLYTNQHQPLRAKQMVSHAWGEDYADFVQAIEYSGCEGPFWVCAMAIYQENDVVIAQQLGPSLENGPFSTVLKQATDMVAVFTPAADIYLRMWCVFEIFIAVKYGVNIHFAASNRQIRSGTENIYDAIYEHGKNRCQSQMARCGNKSDEDQIRKLIISTSGKFDLLDSVVERCKALYYISEARHPGPAFQDESTHLLLLGGRGKNDYLAKTLSAAAISIDRFTEISTKLKNYDTKNYVDDDTSKGDGNGNSQLEASRCCSCLII